MIKFIQDKCIGCHICEIICSMEHHNKIKTNASCIKYLDNWPQIGLVEFCRQCSGRSCIDACPEDALHVTEKGFVKVNETKCTSCFACSDACPFGDLPKDEKYPLFCDTCDGLYKCVKWCPSNSLILAGDNE